MGVLDLLTTFTIKQDEPTIKQEDTEPIIKQEEEEEEESKVRVPKAIRDLQNQLSPTLLSPKYERRTKRKNQEIGEFESPLKKKKIIIQSESNGLISPPITPSKIVKPAFALNELDQTIKDPVSKKLIFTPEKDQLISPPITPSYPPKQLNLEDKENVPTKECSIFTKAKAVFQRSYNNENENMLTLPERYEEGKALNEFFIQNIIESNSTSLYISGPPGTGKTAQTKLTLSKLIDLNSNKSVQLCEINGKDYRLRYTYINCMTITRISNIYQEIYKNLTKTTTNYGVTKETLFEALCDSSESDMNIIILDELDKLITTDQQILFEIFSWILPKESKMILVGISNALDMVDRLLPRLKMNGLNPNTLTFLPYDSNQIENIIKSKLRLLNSNLIHPAAIKLAAKKSSSNTGDLRKAFDICRRSIELVEKEVRGENIFNENHSNKEEVIVKINHVLKICNNVFNNNQTIKLKNLNFLQKHIVCLLIKLEINNFKDSIKFKNGLTINSFYEYYLKNGKIDSLIGILKKGEFLEILTTIESVGIIQITKSSRNNFTESKISSNLVKKDFINSIKGITALEKIINEKDIGII